MNIVNFFNPQRIFSFATPRTIAARDVAIAGLAVTVASSIAAALMNVNRNRVTAQATDEEDVRFDRVLGDWRQASYTRGAAASWTGGFYDTYRATYIAAAAIHRAHEELLTHLFLDTQHLSSLPNAELRYQRWQQLTLHLTSVAGFPLCPEFLRRLHLHTLYLGNGPEGVTFHRRRGGGSSCGWHRIGEIRHPLTVLPEWIGELRQLQHLYIQDNLLERFPRSILELPNTCTVHAEHNRFSAVFVEEFQRRLQLHREAHPGEGPTVLMTVYEEHPLHVRIPDVAVGEADPLLVRFMTRLQLSMSPEAWERAAPFRGRFADGMRDVAPFREAALASITDGLAACGDRILLTWDDLHVLYLIHCRENSIEDLTTLAIGYHRQRTLDAWVAGQARERRAGDALEVQFYVRHHLRNILTPLMITEGMLYAGIGRGVIPDADIDAQGRIIVAATTQRGDRLRILCATDFWQAEIQRRYPARFTEFDAMDRSPILRESDAEFRARLSAMGTAPLEAETDADFQARVLSTRGIAPREAETDAAFQARLAHIQAQIQQRVREITNEIVPS